MVRKMEIKLTRTNGSNFIYGSVTQDFNAPINVNPMVWGEGRGEGGGNNHISLAEEKLVKHVECMNYSQSLFSSLGISLFCWAEGAWVTGYRLPQGVQTHQPLIPLGRWRWNSKGNVLETLVPFFVGKLRCVGQPTETPASDWFGPEEDELPH